MAAFLFRDAAHVVAENAAHAADAAHVVAAHAAHAAHVVAAYAAHVVALNKLIEQDMW